MPSAAARDATRRYALDPLTGEMRHRRHGWLLDPSVRNTVQPGAPGVAQKPPEGHVRRCQRAKSKSRPPAQCRNWACRGEAFCHYHGGGHRSLWRGRRIDLRFYDSALGPTLREKLRQMSEEPPDDRLSLLEESDLARLTAIRSLRIFEATCVDPETADRASDELKGAATAAARGAIEYVCDTVMKAAKVRALNESTYDVEQLDYFVGQVGRIVNDEVGSLPGGPDLVAAVTKRLRAIKLPGRDRAKMTTDDARERAERIRDQLAEMDESVPSAAPSAEKSSE